MSIVLFNPTNEDFEAWHNGVALFIPKCGEKGHKVKVDDARGNHILNHLGRRGLMKLEYGDEEREDKIAEQGRLINLEFKRNMVEKHNQENEARHQKHMSYTKPSDQLVAYAKEIGEELIKPYQLKSRQSETNAKLVEENTDLRERLDRMEQQFTDLMAALGEKTSPEETPDRKEFLSIQSKYKMMNRKNYPSWVQSPEGRETYHCGIIEIQDDMRDKWEKFTDEGTPFPY